MDAAAAGAELLELDLESLEELVDDVSDFLSDDDELDDSELLLLEEPLVELLPDSRLSVR